MSSTKRVITVGASARRSDVQKISDTAAAADDRAVEVSFTPGAALKRVMPLTEESATVNPRFLVVGKDTDATLAVGKVRVRPAHFSAGSDAFSIALAKAQKLALDSAVFASNGGATRTDLLYATVSMTASLTEAVRVKPAGGGDPASQNLTTQQDPVVTLNIVAGVSAVTPLASLPADDTVNGVYNFGLAAVSIPNGFAGITAINQAAITPLWSSGWTQPHRVRGHRPMSLYYGVAAEKPASSVLSNGVQGAERWGSDVRFVAHLRNLPTTGTTLATGVLLDNSIDWRNRIVWGFCSYTQLAGNTVLENAAATQIVSPPVTLTGANPVNVPDTGILPPAWSGPGAAFGLQTAKYSDGAGTVATIAFGVDTSGNLRMFRIGSPLTATNGDLLLVVIHASDRLLAGT